MSWMDDLETRVKQSGSGDTTISDIATWIENARVDNSVAIAKEAGANLTVQQLADGLTNASRALAPAHSTAEQNQNAQSASQIAARTAGISIPVILAFVALFYFMKKGGKRG